MFYSAGVGAGAAILTSWTIGAGSKWNGSTTLLSEKGEEEVKEREYKKDRVGQERN